MIRLEALSPTAQVVPMSYAMIDGDEALPGRAVVAANDEPRIQRDLAEGLPGLLPRLANWAKEQELISLAAGKPLAPWQVEDARQVGILRPEKVRIHYVDSIPQPVDAQLRETAARTGLIGRENVGVTLGYAVLILRGCVGLRRVLRRHLRHVAQMENVGSSVGFLGEYLRQITWFGLAQAPFRLDAHAHETPSLGDARPRLKRAL
jgi:hypothetical protein